MSSIVLVKQEIGDRVGEAAEVAGYSERNFRRYLADKMVQALPLGCVRNLYNAGLISKATYRTVKRERIVEIINMKKETPCLRQSIKKFATSLYHIVGR